MVSNTKQTWNRRIARHKKMGAARKRLMRRGGTPTFPVHPEGYDSSAPDAKPAPEASGPSAVKGKKAPSANQKG
ncbi:MAG: hypothetical protein AAGN82_23035 [Myxococcota bacterium]